MQKQVQTSFLNIDYEERGEKEASCIILIHGFPEDAQTWNAVTDSLVKKGYRILASVGKEYFFNGR